MRLIFMGSPDVAIAPLKALLEADPQHEVVGVVSQPARPAGRKRKLTDPPVAAHAKQIGLNVLQPESAKAEDFLDSIRGLQPDVIITAAYGQILSNDFLAIPRRATINIHPSLLPSYRGATPVPATLVDGHQTTGVTILFTVRRMDAGAIILQETTDIGSEENAGELTDRLFRLGASLLPAALEKLKDKDYSGDAQDESLVTRCRKLTKENGEINWQDSAKKIHDHYRACAPWPGTFTYFENERLNITAMTSASGQPKTLPPGTAYFDKATKMVMVSCGGGFLAISRIKPQGRKEVDALAFWNGLKKPEQILLTTNPGEEG